MTPLALELRAMIEADGPIGIDRFMQICLQHPVYGYYTTRESIGRAGDFTTAPEISQMFGELLGLWAAQTWRDQGAPAAVALVELGPGRGTLMADALRAVDRVRDFAAVVRVHLVETSPRLRALQAEALAGRTIVWHRAIDEIPPGFVLIVANEFLDALPVRHYQRMPGGWHERVVGLDADGHLAFGVAGAPLAMPPGRPPVWPPGPDAAPGTILEIGHAAADVVSALAGRIARDGGAALLIDYGHSRSGFGETLQAVRGHAYADVLAEPGLADLTAHVDFAAMARAAEQAGARACGPLEQGALLARLGLHERAAALARAASTAQTRAIAGAAHRLTAPEDMGTLFKALAVVPHGAPVPPAFEEAA